jgi:adenosine deaminase
MKTFIEQLPKAELHVHLEGTLEPEMSFALAQRNQVSLPYATPADIIAAYDFHDLPSFLSIYYKAMEVLITEQDFYDMTWAYLAKAASQNVVYAEMFFDPQAHTSRGVAFETIISGIHKAQLDAAQKLGVETQLILCFLRDLSAESAMETLLAALPYKHWLVGVGLDSDEKDNPPLKFAAVFKLARENGLKLTMHCDVHQKNTHEHIRQVLDEIVVDRIDHGINTLDQQPLYEEVAKRGLGLTICPVSNRFVVQNLTTAEIRRMLQLGMKATVNSDDPAYFRAYMNENFVALAEDGMTREEIVQLVRNSFDVAWLPTERKQHYLDLVTSRAAA